MEIDQEMAAAGARLRELCGVLRDLGIEKVVADYDGYGDEGGIEDVRALGDKEKEMPLDDTLANEVGDLVIEFLPGGCFNNEGSTGCVELLVAQPKLLVHHGERVEEIDESEYEYEL